MEQTLDQFRASLVGDYTHIMNSDKRTGFMLTHLLRVGGEGGSWRNIFYISQKSASEVRVFDSLSAASRYYWELLSGEFWTLDSWSDDRVWISGQDQERS